MRKIIIMGIFSSLFSFIFGQKMKQELLPFYPNDHKLSMEERKNVTIKFLKQIKIPTIEDLPCIEDYTAAEFQTDEDVASKAIVLYGLIYVCHNEKSPKEMIEYFKKYNLWKFVSPNERNYLNNRTEKEDNQISWRVENLNVLFWSLNLFDKLELPIKMCDFSNYQNLPNLDIDPTEWIKNMRLRNKEDILNQADLIYRIHWAMREAELNEKKIPMNMNSDVIYERHFALNWLIKYAESWDEITTDT